MTSFFIDYGPYVLGALFVLLLITVWCALKAASDADDLLEVSPARVPPTGAATAPAAPVRAEDMGVGLVGTEFDAEFDWAWANSSPKNNAAGVLDTPPAA